MTDLGLCLFIYHAQIPQPNKIERPVRLPPHDRGRVLQVKNLIPYTLVSRFLLSYSQHVVEWIAGLGIAFLL